MPLSDEVRNLLLKYIAGETDEAESAMVESWLENDPAVFKEFEQLWDLWYAVGTATNVFHFNVDKGWDSLMNRSTGGRHAAKKRGRLRVMILAMGAVAAAAVVFFAVMPWYGGFHQQQPAEGSRLALSATTQGQTAIINGDSMMSMEAKTRPGTRRRISLPDGSIAWLNGNTHIRYLLDGKTKKRMLYLSGQAFFDIRHHAAEPFIVKTKHASIQVLGTRFDVVAYPQDAVTEAVLTGGSILFTTESKHKRISRHIDPGQKISIDYLSGKLKITDVDTAFYACWREGKLLFRNETFEEVARAMAHKYGVSFEFRDDALKGKRLNGYLQKESLEEALKALQLTLQFQYQLSGDKVIIFQ